MAATSLDGFYKKEVRRFQKSFRHLAKFSLITASPPTLWYTTYRIYIAHLQTHIEDLTNLLNDCAQDYEKLLSLRFSSILSLTTLAQIGHILVKGRPDATALREERNTALRRVLLLVSELGLRDFTLRLDPFICVSSFFLFESK